MPRCRRHAVSLVEVLLASAVFAVMMVPMMGMFQLGNRMTASGERRIQATLFAHQVVETLRAEMDRWADNTRGVVGMPRLALTAPKGYTYGVHHQAVEEGLERFVVTVRWNESRKGRELKLETVVSRAGAQRVVARGRGDSGRPLRHSLDGLRR